MLYFVLEQFQAQCLWYLLEAERQGNTEDRGSVTRNQDSVAQVQNCHPAKSTLLIFHSTVKPVLSRHLKTGEKKVLKTDGSLMQGFH